MEVEAVIVNYGTPRLTRRAVWSLNSLYPNLDIVVVDNASPDDSVAVLKREFGRLAPVRLRESPVNLHHGPAMDRAVREAVHEWVLLLDSDCVAYRAGFLDRMLDTARSREAYMVGEVRSVDGRGFNTLDDDAGHRYVHPKCALVRREKYLELPPFEKHGAPCLANAITAAEHGYALVDFPVDDYVFHLGRGTVEEHGYGLGWRSMAANLKRRLKQLL